MKVSQVKMSNFEQMVLREAEAKRDAMIAAVNKEKKEEIAKIKAQIESETQNYIEKTEKKLAKEKNERIVHKQLLAKQKLLEERNALMDSLFERVRTRLVKFAASSEYEEYLLEMLKSCREKFPTANKVILSKQDEKYAAKIESLGFEISYTDDNIIGGLILIDEAKAIRIDETIASKLHEARESFLETYNLKI